MNFFWPQNELFDNYVECAFVTRAGYEALTDASLAVGREDEADVAQTLVAAVEVDAAAVCTHARRTTLVVVWNATTATSDVIQHPDVLLVVGLLLLQSFIVSTI